MQTNWASVEAATAAKNGAREARRIMRRNRLAALDRLRELHSQLGGEPRPELLDPLYRPSVPHECIPEQEDEWWNTVHRIRLEGVAGKRL